MSSAILYLAIVAIWAVFLVPRWVRRAHTAPEGGVADLGEHAGAADADAAAETPRMRDRLPAAPARPKPTLSQRSILRARRRTMATLVALAAIAAACTAYKLTPWWVCVPPGGMLGMYLLLLREAALADAEHARWRADEAARAARAARQRARSVQPALVPVPDAKIIDISRRVGDQLYDQYADARAIGD